MNPLVELNLTLILFLPWFLILVGLFWVYPRQPRGLWRRLYDVAAVLLSLGAFVASPSHRRVMTRYRGRMAGSQFVS